MKASNRDAKQAGAGRAKRLQVVYRPIGELSPDPANPRLHSKKQIRQIANSIETFELKKGVNGSLLCYVAAPDGVSIELMQC